jgi:hypothetical protein
LLKLHCGTCCNVPAGLLLLNRSVYRGAAIMTDPHEVPEQQFPLGPAADPDALINMQPMRRQLAACTAGSSSGVGGLQLTPGLGQMYTLLEQALQRVPGQQQQQQGRSSVDVAAIMEQATRECINFLSPTCYRQLWVLVTDSSMWSSV